ncbi:MAG: hypothetical protein AB7O71_10765 [Hyphomicrobiaceae bacterium]
MHLQTCTPQPEAVRQIARDAVNLHIAWIKQHRTTDDRCEIDLEELMPPEAIALGPALYDALHDLGCRVRVDDDDEGTITVQIPWRGVP